MTDAEIADRVEADANLVGRFRSKWVTDSPPADHTRMWGDLQRATAQAVRVSGFKWSHVQAVAFIVAGPVPATRLPVSRDSRDGD